MTTTAAPRTASAAQPPPGPGVFSSRMLREAIQSGRISPKRIPATQIQPASIDLRLGAKAYRLRSSFLPGPNARVRDRLPELQMGAPLDLADPEGVVLEPGRPYLVKLMESVRLPEGAIGRTNPRSSTGRLDVFTRVISDRGTQFDEVEPGYEGPLWLEVYSNTFTVNVRQGLALTQLRISSGDSWLDAAAIGELHAREGLVFEEGSTARAPRERVEAPRIGPRGLLVSVDLPGGQFCGWRAKRNSALLDLARTDAYDPFDYWEPVFAEPGRAAGDPAGRLPPPDLEGVRQHPAGCCGGDDRLRPDQRRAAHALCRLLRPGLRLRSGPTRHPGGLRGSCARRAVHARGRPADRAPRLRADGGAARRSSTAAASSARTSSGRA